MPTDTFQLLPGIALADLPQSVEANPAKCNDCHEYFHTDCRIYMNDIGQHICKECFENYTTCDDCNDTIHNDRRFYHAGRGREVTLCGGCYRLQCLQDEDEDEGPRLIHDYSYKPLPIFHRIPGECPHGAVYFGLEIECEYVGSDRRNSALGGCGLAAQDTWYAKRDGSLNEHTGVEMVSHPGTWQYWQENAFDLLDKMQKTRFRSYDTSTCGMHVHILRNAFTDLRIWKLMEFFRQNEKLITRLSRRQGDSLEEWAGINKGPGGKAARTSKKLVAHAAPVLVFDPKTCDYVNAIGRRRIHKQVWDHHDRYAAINLKNKATVEIRIFRGTLSVESIKRNIALCAALTAFVRYTDINNLSQADFVRFLATEASKTIGHQWSSVLITWIAGRHTDTDATC